MMLVTESKGRFPQAYKAIEHMLLSLDTHPDLDVLSERKIANLDKVIEKLGTQTLGEFLGSKCLPSDTYILAWAALVVDEAESHPALVAKLGSDGRRAVRYLNELYNAAYF